MSTETVNDFPYHSGKLAGMNMLRQIREARGLTQKELAERLHTTDVSVSRYEKEDSRLNLPLLRKISEVLDCSIGELIGERPLSDTKIATLDIPGVQKGAANLKIRADRSAHPVHPASPVPEIDVRAGMGAGGEALLEFRPDGNGGLMEMDAVTALWELPPDYLHRELRVRPGAARIIEVQGDSMEPLLQSGDRVMVNLLDRAPSPPGVFAVWDGIGVVVKRLEFIPNSDPPCIVISSDNQKHRTYERTADEVNIIGRVVWFARRM
ncbi:XRE family transcriptional regulator [Azospirillum thermophilum]|uniref:HTH cro/C1-type domain-containing protein n=1 Tax=Azospirillum thermophilum TaxID=2202148 RepID=A0A2S2CKM3_9PROT|nr:LexA family transcriptional regulator [Azospirillum thermophilum]AWK85053.1 hypothetical protein DEW08_01615 [Azospirillum thermophilum]